MSSLLPLPRTGGPLLRSSSDSARAVKRTVHDRGQVESVRGPMAGVVVSEPGCTPLDKPDSADAVTTGGVREPDTDLGETLPQVAFSGWTRLPAGHEDLMRREGSSLLQQSPGEGHRLRWRQRLFGDRLDASSPIGQRPAKSIARPSLAGATSSVPVPVTGHGSRSPGCS